MSDPAKLFPTLTPDLVNQILTALPFDEAMKTSGLNPLVNLSKFGFLFSNPKTGDMVQFRVYEESQSFKIRMNHRMVAYEDATQEFYYSFDVGLTIRVIITPVAQLMNTQARVQETDRLFEVSIKEQGDPSVGEVEVAFFDLIARGERLMWPKGELTPVASISSETLEQIFHEYLDHNLDGQFKQVIEIYKQLLEKENK